MFKFVKLYIVILLLTIPIYGAQKLSKDEVVDAYIYQLGGRVGYDNPRNIINQNLVVTQKLVNIDEDSAETMFCIKDSGSGLGFII